MHAANHQRIVALEHRDRRASPFRGNQQSGCHAWRHALLFFVLVFCAVSPIVSIPEKAAIFILIGLLLAPGLTRSTRNDIFLLFIFAAIFIYSLIVDFIAKSHHSGDITQSLYYIPMCLFVGFLVSCRYSFDQYLKLLESMMFWMAIASLVLFSILLAWPNFADKLPSYTFEDAQNRTALFLNVLYADGFLMKRNAGFASEPGVFQMLLNMALYYNFSKGRYFTIRNAAYVASILTGFSTAGIAIMLVIFVIFSNIRTRVLIIALCLISAPFVESMVNYQVNNKLAGTQSFYIRYAPSINAFKIVLDHPTGIGSVQYSIDNERYNIGSYDAYSQTAMRYGLQGLLVLLFCLGAVVISAGGIGIILAMSYVTNSFWYLPVFSCFFFWAINSLRSRRSRSGQPPNLAPAVRS